MSAVLGEKGREVTDSLVFCPGTLVATHQTLPHRWMKSWGTSR